MGMIMNKSGKFKDRHPKAYKVIRVVTILFFCFSFFFVGVFVGLTFQVAGDYKDGYVSGRIDYLFNPPIHTPPSSGLIPVNYSSVPSFIEVPSGNSSYHLGEIPNYDSQFFTFLFGTTFFPFPLLNYSSVSTEFLQVNFSLNQYAVFNYEDYYANDLRPLAEYRSLIPREITRNYNSHSVVYSQNYRFLASSVSYSISDIKQFYSLDTVADFFNILVSFSDSHAWSSFLSLLQLDCVTTYYGGENTLDGSVPGLGYLIPRASSIFDIEFPVYTFGGKSYIFPLIVVTCSFSNSVIDFVSSYSSYALTEYIQGFKTGYEHGSTDGYNNGYSFGYDKGFSDAVDSGAGINIDWLLSFSNSFLSIPVFGGFTLGNFLMVGIMLASFGGLLKLFFGG